MSVAITAIPPSGANLAGMIETGSSTTCSTPGRARALLASWLTGAAPTTGGRAMTATFMPGSITSAP